MSQIKAYDNAVSMKLLCCNGGTWTILMGYVPFAQEGVFAHSDRGNDPAASYRWLQPVVDRRVCFVGLSLSPCLVEKEFQMCLDCARKSNNCRKEKKEANGGKRTKNHETGPELRLVPCRALVRQATPHPFKNQSRRPSISR